MTAILAAIDAVIQERCGHCEAPIPADSGSGWFCAAACQREWAAAHHGVQQLRQGDADHSGYQDDAMIWDPNRQEQERIWREKMQQWQRGAAERRAREEQERQEWWDSLTPQERAERQQQLWDGIQEAGAVAVRQITDAFAALTKALAPELNRVAKTAAAFGEAGLCTAHRRVPQDAQERALEFVRNRNTGPKPSNRRAPRSIEPRRAR